MLFVSLKMGPPPKYKAEIYCILQVVYYFDSFCHFVVVVSVVSVWSLGSFRFCRFGDFACLVLFVWFVPFQSFRFAVSGFSTCQLKGCNVVCVKFPIRPSIAPSLHGQTIACLIPIVALFRSLNIKVIYFCFI